MAEKLPPGYEQLVSYYIPGLQGGKHTITVEQYVKEIASEHASPGTREDPAPKPKPVATTTQPFDVVAPQFSLPSDTIHSTYPPQGQQEQAYTLPHVIFNDPTFPWARHVGAPNWKDWQRNQTPWLAVLVFTADEIGLDARYLRNGELDLFTEVDPKVAVAPGPTLAVKLPVAELANLAKNSRVASAMHKPDDGLPEGATTEVLFVKKPLFSGLFTERDSAGQPTNVEKPYIYAHRFLAHRRDINTQGMAVAGAATSYSEPGEEDDSGSFGVVFSSRTGPPDVTSPTVVYVHLVSLEGIEEMEKWGQWPAEETASFVTLPSLHSWSYVCLPKGTADVRMNFETLGANIDVLMPSLASTTSANAAKMADYRRRAAATGLDNPDFAVADDVLRRIESGYSMARYRTQTGEVTACLTRGPLVPSAVPPAPDWWPGTSMDGTDLHILDPTLGLMDLSYANAWQIGRCMALGDEAFTSALYRVRHQILTRATAKAQKNTVDSHAKASGVRTQLFKDKSDLLRSLPDLIEGLQSLGLMEVKPAGEHHDNEEKETHKEYMRCRWSRTSAESPDLSYHGPVMKPMMVDLVVQAAFEVASTPCKEDPTQPDPDVLYDEYNTPFSTDWAAVLHWVLDRLCLDQIPAHNLVTDASHVPPESVRFFAVDALWMATLVDGALSFGNHIDQELDGVRAAIKEVINAFLSRPRSVASYPYPIPRYGCFVRSKLVSQFPDLTVEAGLGAGKSVDADGAPLLLRHDIVGDGLMLCLFRTAPDPATFTQLTFTQPPHQQTFMAGHSLNDESIEILYRMAFTTTTIGPDVDPHKPLTDITWNRTGVNPPDHKIVYLWDEVGSSGGGGDPVALRLLLMDNLSDDYRQYLQDHMPNDSHGNKYFEDKIASSALMGYQCNNPSWILPIAARVPPGNSAGSKPEEAWAFPISRSKSRRPPRRRLLAGPTRPTLKQTPRIYGGFLDRPERSGNDKDERPGLKHVRIFVPPPVQPPPATPRLNDVATFPQFLYRFWPASAQGRTSSEEAGSIPMLADGTPQDIVVSIIRTSQPYDYNLQEIRIKLPLGPADDDDDPEDPAFMEAYTGNEGRPAMLSNLRMTPLVSHAADGKSMYLRLIPRSISRVDRRSDADDVPTVPAKMCAELSFVLPSVVVNVFKQTEPVKIYPKVVEIYPNEIPQTPLTPPVIVLRSA